MREQLNMNKYGKSQHDCYLMKNMCIGGTGLEGLLVSVSAN